MTDGSIDADTSGWHAQLKRVRLSVWTHALVSCMRQLHHKSYVIDPCGICLELEPWHVHQARLPGCHLPGDGCKAMQLPYLSQEEWALSQETVTTDLACFAPAAS